MDNIISTSLKSSVKRKKIIKSLCPHMLDGRRAIIYRALESRHVKRDIVNF